MAKRLGTVLVFRPGTTREAAEAAVATLAGVLDGGYFIKDGEEGYEPVLARVEEFEDSHGGPVWYIP